MVRGLIMRAGRTPRRAIIGLSIASILLALSLTSRFAQRRGDESQSIRPRRALAQDSRTITVKAVEKPQAAIDGAKFGDTILLQAGATFIEQVMLPYKGPGTNTDADYITIRTSNSSGIPAEGERLRPSQHASAPPKILAPRGQSVLATNLHRMHLPYQTLQIAVFLTGFVPYFAWSDVRSEAAEVAA